MKLATHVLAILLWITQVLDAAPCEDEAEYCYPCNLVQQKNNNFFFVEFVRACAAVDFDELKSRVPEFADVPLSCTLFDFPNTEPPPGLLLDEVAYDVLNLNFQVQEEQLPALTSALSLPDGLELAKITTIQGSSPKYYLTQSFYKSFTIEGVELIRSQWITYVTAGDDTKPRFLVLESFSSEDSTDPTNPPTFLLPATDDISYSIDEENLIYIKNPGFEATFPLPAGEHDNGERKLPKGKKGKKAENGKTSKSKKKKKGEPDFTMVYMDLQWVEANDFTYYTTGIGDKKFYNGHLFDEPLLSINPSLAVINNVSPWGAYIRDMPENIVKYENPLPMGLIPFFNVLDPSFDPVYAAQATAYRDTFFAAQVYFRALQTFTGEAEPALKFDVDTDSVPSFFANFRINDVEGLRDYLNLPSNFELAKIRMTESEPEDFLVSLNIYELIGFAGEGRQTRAEWSVYVKDKTNMNAKPYFMVIDVDSDTDSLDSFNGPTPANEEFVYSVTGNTANTEIKKEGTGNYFSMTFEMPSSDDTTAVFSREFIVANDRIYWRSGSYDYLFYNGQFWDADLAEVDLDTVTIADDTPWANFMDPSPTQVLVIRNGLEYFIRPWYNVEELCEAVESP